MPDSVLSEYVYSCSAIQGLSQQLQELYLVMIKSKNWLLYQTYIDIKIKKQYTFNYVASETEGCPFANNKINITENSYNS